MSRPPGGPALEVTDAPPRSDTELLLRELVAFNRPFLGPEDHRRLAVMARVGGELVGGLVGETVRGLLFVELLWLAPGHRRRGLGSRLLVAAEAEARRRWCGTAWLDTFDFQARPFYERHGYGVFGELGGLPGGHRRWFMTKRLGPGSGGEP